MTNVATKLALVVSLVALAACDAPSQPTRIALDTGAVPGTTLVDSQAAAIWFNRVCIDTAPSFNAAPAVLTAPVFKQSRTTGTYFHQTLNMSFKLIKSGDGTDCSMVFVSTDSPNILAIALSLATSDDGNIGIDPTTGGAQTAGPSGTTFTFRPSNMMGGGQMFQALLQK